MVERKRMRKNKCEYIKEIQIKKRENKNIWRENLRNYNINKLKNLVIYLLPIVLCVWYYLL